MKKLGIFFFVGVLCFGLFVSCEKVREFLDETEPFELFDDFHSIDEERWIFLGGTGLGKGQEETTAGVSISEGIMSLEVVKTNDGPFMHGEAIPITDGDVLTIERRVKVSPASDKHLGGIFIRGTEQAGLHSDFEVSIVNIQYVDYSWDGSTHQGDWNLFVLNQPLWVEQSPNQLFNTTEPVWNEWFEEKIVYDSGTGNTTYFINGEKVIEAQARSEIENDFVKVIISPYGWYTGHKTQMEWISVTLE